MKADTPRTPTNDPAAMPGAQPAADAQVGGREALLQRQRELQQQRRQLKERANRTSRQIGEARREGRGFEDLKTTMRSCSRELKALDAQLKAIRDRIAGRAPPVAEEDAAALRSRHRTTVERYRLSSFDDDSRLTIRVAGEDDRQEWNAYCEGHAAATIHHRYEWKGILQSSYGLESFFLSARIDGRISGLLPLARHTSRLFGDFMVSMPWFASGGAVGDHPDIEQRLMQAAGELGSELGVDHVEFRDTVPRETWPVQSHKVNMVLELPQTHERLWQSFPSKLRAQVRRPQREHPEVVFGGAELLEDFYRVYARNMRDLGSPLHSRAFIRATLDHFPDDSRLVLVRLQGRPVGGGLLLGRGDTLEIPLASTIRDVNPLGVNMLMYWEVLRFAIENGCRYFDFGRSTRDAGTYRFKQQWGAEPRPLYWHYWLGADGEMPSLNPDNPKYALLIAAWKRLPVWLTSRLGAGLMKHVP